MATVEPGLSERNQSVPKRTRACLSCLRDYAVNPRHVEEHRFCSADCRARWHRVHPGSKAIEMPPLEPHQRALDWSPREGPTVSDPNAPSPVRRRALSYNRRLLARLMEGTHIRSDEAEQIAGKRAAARIHDIRVWLRSHGYQGQDPVPVMAVDREARCFSWRMTGSALELARMLSVATS